LYTGVVAAFLGREPELATLAGAWDRAQAGRPQLAIMWGRRRVGKTYLLTHFAQGKRAVYFTATRQDHEARQLGRLTDEIREQLGDEVTDLLPGPFEDWAAALRFLIRLSDTRPLLVVIDEAPRLLNSRPDFADLVSAIWENRVRDHRLMLVLTGSAVAVMEEMIGAQGGLHRRATVEQRLDPFPLHEARAFIPRIPAADFVQAYAACGGYPLHLMQWNPDASVSQNLATLAFSPAGLLVRDAMDILSEDLDWRGGYERVLTAIGSGSRRRSRIAGRAQQRIDYTLDRLRRAGFVHQVHPVGSPTSDPHYEIADHYLAFWFSVLRDDVDLIEGGQGEAIRLRTAGRWQTHLGRVFEAAARDHAVRLVQAGELPHDLIIGRWWKDEHAEIDVLGLRGDRTALIGECRWQSKPITERDVGELYRKLRHVPSPLDDVQLLFWSRAGLAPSLIGGDHTLRGYTAEPIVDG
jgi:uncharacterized protein